MDKGYIIGTVSTREVYLLQTAEPYLQNEYIMAASGLDRIPLEVQETWALPMFVPESIPNCNPLFLKKININEEEPVFLARAKVLKPLKQPMMPLSKLEKPSFEEMREYLIHAKVADSMHMGIINGTETMQNELPEELSNISPLWENKQAVAQSGIPFMFNHHHFREYPHVGIFGTSGSGKTFGLRVFVEELMKLQVPGLVLDPHNEMEFKRPMDGLPNSVADAYKNSLQYFEVGQNMGIQFEELALGELVYLIEFVGSISDPMRGALESVYEEGDTYLHLKDKLTKLREAFENFDKPEKSQEELNSDVLSLYYKHRNRIPGTTTLQALTWRLEALYATNVFNSKDGIRGIEQAIANGKMAILRGDLHRLKMVSFYVIRKLYHRRRKWSDNKNKTDDNKGDYFPAFFVIVDEAHNFAPKMDSNPTKRILKEIAQEARKYGVFEIFCTQKPDGLDETIFAQLNTKVIYRLNTMADMELVKKETNLTEEQMAQLPELTSGNCFFSSATLPKTFSVRFRSTFTKSPHTLDPFDELALNRQSRDLKLEGVLAALCEGKIFKTTDISEKLPNIAKEMGRPVSADEVRDTLAEMAKSGALEAKGSSMGVIYRAIA